MNDIFLLLFKPKKLFLIALLLSSKAMFQLLSFLQWLLQQFSSILIFKLLTLLRIQLDRHLFHSVQSLNFRVADQVFRPDDLSNEVIWLVWYIQSSNLKISRFRIYIQLLIHPFLLPSLKTDFKSLKQDFHTSLEFPIFLSLNQTYLK